MALKSDHRLHNHSQHHHLNHQSVRIAFRFQIQNQHHHLYYLKITFYQMRHI